MTGYLSQTNQQDRRAKLSKRGRNSGGRKYLHDRNEEIRKGFLNGSSIVELSDTFCLSCSKK